MRHVQQKDLATGIERLDEGPDTVFFVQYWQDSQKATNQAAKCSQGCDHPQEPLYSLWGWSRHAFRHIRTPSALRFRTPARRWSSKSPWRSADHIVSRTRAALREAPGRDAPCGCRRVGGRIASPL